MFGVANRKFTKQSQYTGDLDVNMRLKGVLAKIVLPPLFTQGMTLP